MARSVESTDRPGWREAGLASPYEEVPLDGIDALRALLGGRDDLLTGIVDDERAIEGRRREHRRLLRFWSGTRSA